MSQRLTDMSITRVSLVDKGANQRRIAVLKRDEEASMSEQVAAAIAKVDGDEHAKAGIAGWLRKAADVLLGRPDPVVKTATFAEVVAGQELTDALSDSFYTLQDVLWSAIYACDENGQSLSIEAKTAFVAQDLDEFKTYLLGQMAAVSVAKADLGSAEQRRLGALVRKAGKKISGSRLERLAAAAEALNSVLAEVAEVANEKADEAEEVDVDKAEMVAAFTEAMEPIAKRVAALEEAKPVVKTDTEAESGAEAGDDAPATLETVVTVIEKLVDRIAAIEGAGAVRKSLAGQDGGSEPIKKSKWAGVF
jgi:histone H3/H4